jgi:hypothetical protein
MFTDELNDMSQNPFPVYSRKHNSIVDVKPKMYAFLTDNTFWVLIFGTLHVCTPHQTKSASRSGIGVGWYLIHLGYKFWVNSMHALHIKRKARVAPIGVGLYLIYFGYKRVVLIGVGWYLIHFGYKFWVHSMHSTSNEKRESLQSALDDT